MIVYHLTPTCNAAAIMWEGLRIKHSIGVPRIWFYTASKRGWALAHVARHQHCQISDLTELTFNIPRGWLKRWRRGIWLCYRDVPYMFNANRKSIVDLLMADSVENTPKDLIVYANPHSLTGAEFPIRPESVEGTLTEVKHG